MALGRIAPEDSDALLQYFASYRGPIYAGLVFDDPFIVNDPLSVEVLGSAYRRTLLQIELVDHVLRNLYALSWSVGNLTSVAGVAGWDASFNGSPRFYTPYAAPIDYPTGGIHQHPALDLYIGLDS